MRPIYRICLCLFSFVLLISAPPLATAQPVTSQAPSPALLPAPAAPGLPGDEFWDPVFASESVSGPVYTYAIFSNKVCIGGDFHQAGNLPAENIACLDTYVKTWTTLGSGMSGPVYALAYSGDGKIYAGGRFSQAGSVGAQNIARWNPVTKAWEDIGGASGPVYALRAYDNYLYVGGQFGQVGNVAANNVARFNITTQVWSALTDNLFANGVSGPVYTLDVSGPSTNLDVFVGGMFTGIGGVSGINAYNIARWNSFSNTWSEVGGSVSGPVYAFTICNGALHVGGLFSQAGSVAANNIASWNLTSKVWSPLGQGTSNAVEVLACVDNRLYAGGRFNQAGDVAANFIARWNFDLKRWAALGGGASGPVFTIFIISSQPTWTHDVYIGGQFAGAGTTGSSNLARFTGDYDQTNPDDVHWSVPFCTQPGPNDSVSTINAVGDILYYGGKFTAIGNLTANHLAQYDSRNNTWSVVGSGVDGEVKAIAVSGNYVYVGGAFTTAGGNPIPNLARWNKLNDTWEGLGSGPNGPVNAIAIQGTDVFIGGNFTTAGGVTVNNIARWDSSAQTWNPLGTGTWTGMYGGPVNALAVLGDDLYASGSFVWAQYIQGTQYLARWNGSTWSGLGSGLNNYVYVLAVKDSDLYVGGAFSTAGGLASSSIARWDGAAWHALAAGLGGSVRAIAFNQGDVYVSGGFDLYQYNKFLYDAARWDGAEWWPLGKGIYSGGMAMAVGAKGIYIDGTVLQNGMRCKGSLLWQTPTIPAGSGSIFGQVGSTGGVPLAGATVQACLQSGTPTCAWIGKTGVNGDYQAASLADGEYIVKAYPPQGTSSLPIASGTLMISGGNALQQNLDFTSIAPLPAGVSLTPSRITSAGVPLVNWRQPFLLQAQGCTGGSAFYQVFQNGNVIASGALIEAPTGQFSASLSAFYPKYGTMKVSLGFTCPVLSPQNSTFDIFVDPSGTLRTLKGSPIAEATMTLYAYDPVTLSLIQVPAGSELLSPANQVNPDLTDAGGNFGWDTVAGAYMIRAEKAGCTSPLIPDQVNTDTGLLTSPFDMVDLDLRLRCASDLSFLYLPVVVR